ncbi:MAG: pyridoxal 5'-phosphate synthase glutaminase subunit PdxT [candidate division KSB1 bacterium]|nr:pyridoxal 5'-phosphate synthase glutaminase subunit PdxT [candidate division KSB1 bacterium]
MVNSKNPGILAVQGDFEKHQRMLERLGAAAVLVRNPQQLRECSGLIIPGGESTTLRYMMKKHDLWDAVKVFAETHPVFGTCAGCILMAQEICNDDRDSLKVMDISVRRNAYGRQVDSFIDDIQLEQDTEPFEGVFIRAPKIEKITGTVRVLARLGEHVVWVEQGHLMAATFHPELTLDLRVHEYFINKLDRP